MTRLPHESRLVVDRPDLPEYELNKACPVTGEVTGLENHHLWPRSFGTKSWWIELPDGTVVGNRIMLSPAAHYRVTVNKARIFWDAGIFYWHEADETFPLRWQPPVLSENDEVVFPSLSWIAEKILEEHGGTLRALADEPPAPGHDCPTCKRRVPLPKKQSSPQTKVFSCRVPIDDAEVFSEMVDAAAEHMGTKSRPHHKWATLVVGLALVLQTPKEQLP